MNLMDFNVVPGIAPVDTAATAIESQFVDCKTAQNIEFLASFGTVTAATAGDLVTITVTASSVQAGTSAVGLPFYYRLSGAAAANSWGARTAATSAGYAPTCATLTGNMVHIELDPAILAEESAQHQWVNIVVTPDGNAAACAVAAIPIITPRYVQTDMVSTT